LSLLRNKLLFKPLTQALRHHLIQTIQKLEMLLPGVFPAVTLPEAALSLWPPLSFAVHSATRPFIAFVCLLYRANMGLSITKRQHLSDGIWVI